MKMKNYKTGITIFVVSFFIMIIIFCFNIQKIYAEDDTNLADGKYELDFETSMPAMGMAAFENKAKKVVLEKIKSKYFLTISTDSRQVSNVNIISKDGKVGEEIFVEGNVERHRYSMQKKDLKREIEMSMFVKAMNRRTKPKINLLFNTAKLIGNVESIDKDRPAEIVPVIDINASNIEMEKNSRYILPEAKARIGNSNLIVMVKVYYLNRGNKVYLETNKGFIDLNKEGEYHVVYHAESDQFKTLKGKNTMVDIEIVIISKVGASSIVKIDNIDSLSSESYDLRSSYIDHGSKFEMAKAAMHKISDNFEVISWDIVDKSGNTVNLSKEMPVYLRVNDAYNKNKSNVYMLKEDGTLKEIKAFNYGRYLKVLTKEPGVYVVCQNGVSSNLSLVAKIGISITIVVISGIIIFCLLIIIRNKKMQKRRT